MSDEESSPDFDGPREPELVSLPRVIPDYSQVFKNIVIPDYSQVFKNIVIPDYSEMFKNIVIPDYANLVAGLVVGGMTDRLHQVAFDTTVAVRDVRAHGATTMDISSVLAEVDAVERSLQGDLVTMGEFLRASEPHADGPTTTVGADLSLRWSSAAEDNDPVSLDVLYNVLAEQLFVLDALKDGAQSSNLPTPFEVYNAVVNTIVMLATLAMLLRG